MVISTDKNGKPTVVAGDGDGDLAYLVDLMYPVGSYFMTTHGATNPGKLLGGQWDLVANNVVLPLGNTAPVYASASLNTFNSSDLNALIMKKYHTGAWTDPVNSSPIYMYAGGLTYDQTTSSGAYINQVVTPANLKVRLSDSSNKISGVDIYRRSL